MIDDFFKNQDADLNVLVHIRNNEPMSFSQRKSVEDRGV